MGEAGDRLFPIQSDGWAFFTGVCRDGRQVVMGLLCPEMVAYFFDGQGNLVGREERRWSDAAAEATNTTPPYSVNPELLGLIRLQRREWEAELGVGAATIRVKQFFDHTHYVGIHLQPESFRDIETEAWFKDEREREEYARLRDQWVAEGKFVWCWAEDHHMTADGEVDESS